MTNVPVGFWIAGLVLLLGGMALLLLPLRKYSADAGSRSAVLVSLAVFPLLVIGLYLFTTTQDWEAQNNPEMNGEELPITAMVASLEARLSADGGTVDEWLMLGRSQTQMKNFVQAEAAYRQAWTQSGETSTEAAIGLAEALVYLDRESLNGEAGELVELVLAREPENPRALWFGGLVALADGRQDDAVDRWTRLLKYEMPAELRTVIQQQLVALGAVDSAVDSAPAAASVGFAIDVSIAAELSDAARQAVALYVFVRRGEGGPPLAVKRVSPVLPVSVTLSDADVMMPGGTLAGQENLSVTARLSMSGDPIAAPGDLYVTVDSVSPDAALELIISETVQ